MNKTFQLIRALGLISFICAILIVATHVNTEARIRSNQEIIMRESVAQLLPGMTRQVIYGVEPDGAVTILAGVGGEATKLFAGYDPSGRLLGLVIEASERGYADLITAMYSYNPETQAVTGFSVTDMRETPGLGDRIRTDAAFAQNFANLDATHPIKTVKQGSKKNPWEIDAISGATVSSRAVGRMLQATTTRLRPVIAANLDRIRRGN